MATNGHASTSSLPPVETLTSHGLQPPLSSRSTSVNGQKRLPPTHLYGRLPPYCLKEDGTPDYVRLILTSRVYDLLQPSTLTLIL